MDKSLITKTTFQALASGSPGWLCGSQPACASCPALSRTARPVPSRARLWTSTLRCPDPPVTASAALAPRLRQARAVSCGGGPPRLARSGSSEVQIPLWASLILQIPPGSFGLHLHPFHRGCGCSPSCESCGGSACSEHTTGQCCFGTLLCDPRGSINFFPHVFVCGCARCVVWSGAAEIALTYKHILSPP